MENDVTSSIPARILIVEDDDLVRHYTSTLVSSLGYVVVAAVPLAREALDLLAAGEPVDLLMTDLVMPGGTNGRQLAESVLRDHSEMPILLVSGYEANLSTYDTPPAARLAFLRKPFRKLDLAKSLSALLGDRDGPRSCLSNAT